MKIIHTKRVLVAAAVLTVAALSVVLVLQFLESTDKNGAEISLYGGATDNASSVAADERSREADTNLVAGSVTSKTNLEGTLDPKMSQPLFEGSASTWESPPDSADELFELAASKNKWDKSQVLANYRLWSQACSSSNQLSLAMPSVEAEKYISKEMRQGFSELSAFCGSLHSRSELMALDRFEEILDGSRSQNEPQSARFESLGDELDFRLTNESKLEVALEALARSIRAFDEAHAAFVLWEIANRRLLGYSDLRSAGFWHASLRVTQDVAATLICDEFGGCRGPGHPMVLRYCITKYSNEGFVCNSPASLQDAIFQTSPPVIYDWYLRYYDVIRSELEHL
jgi:hypothetical protein